MTSRINGQVGIDLVFVTTSQNPSADINNHHRRHHICRGAYPCVFTYIDTDNGALDTIEQLTSVVVTSQ